MDYKFGASIIGLPVYVDPIVPQGELWQIEDGGHTTKILCDELPRRGEPVEAWLLRHVIRRINIDGLLGSNVSAPAYFIR